jgi:hypothetical protein
MIAQPYPDERTWWRTFDIAVAARYAAVGRVYPDPADHECFVWRGRTAYDIGAGMDPELSQAKHLQELDEALGITPTPPIPLPAGRVVADGHSFARDPEEVLLGAGDPLYRR